MTTITLSEIKAAQDRLAEMISQYEAAVETPAPITVLTVREAQIEMKAGEVYAGLVLDAEGRASHHLILLPGEAVGIAWEDAKAWADKAGGELPTRSEQALLYANCKRHFGDEWYWSAEQYSDRDAWIQDFTHGYQYFSAKSAELRARAVRRFSA